MTRMGPRFRSTESNLASEFQAGYATHRSFAYNGGEQRMFNPLDHPVVIPAVSLPTFWMAAWIGGAIRARRLGQKENIHDDFAFVIGGTLTLLGLIVGFTFSMAVNRYDQR